MRSCDYDQQTKAEQSQDMAKSFNTISKEQQLLFQMNTSIKCQLNSATITVVSPLFPKPIYNCVNSLSNEGRISRKVLRKLQVFALLVTRTESGQVAPKGPAKVLFGAVYFQLKFILYGSTLIFFVISLQLCYFHWLVWSARVIWIIRCNSFQSAIQ